MIPATTRDAHLQAMDIFDREQRDSPDWSEWEHWRNFKHAIRYEGRLYPVKQVISLATSAPVSSFSGGPEANSYAERHGLEIFCRCTATMRTNSG